VRPLEQMALGGESVARTWRAAGRAAPWVALLPLAAAQALALAALASPVHPASAWIVAGLVERLGGEAALHYPAGFRTLPLVFGLVDAVIAWLAGSLALGAATHAFASVHAGAPARAGESFAAAARRWPALVLAMLPFHAAAAALGGLTPGPAAGHGVTAMLAPPAIVLGRVLLVWLGFHLAALVMLGGHGALAAWRALPRMWSLGLFAALAPLAVALLPLALPAALLADPSLIVERGTPELVATLLAARVVLGAIAVWTVAGASSLTFLVAGEELR
jgi:hypothetical protein